MFWLWSDKEYRRRKEEVFENKNVLMRGGEDGGGAG